MYADSLRKFLDICKLKDIFQIEKKKKLNSMVVLSVSIVLYGNVVFHVLF